MTRRSRLSGGFHLPLAMLSMMSGLGRTRAFQVTTTVAATAARRCSKTGDLSWVTNGRHTARLSVASGARAVGAAAGNRGRGRNGELRMVKVRRPSAVGSGKEQRRGAGRRRERRCTQQTGTGLLSTTEDGNRSRIVDVYSVSTTPRGTFSAHAVSTLTRHTHSTAAPKK